jgi:hypothetical protein
MLVACRPSIRTTRAAHAIFGIVVGARISPIVIISQNPRMHTLRPCNRFARFVDWATLWSIGTGWINVQGERTGNICLRNWRINNLATNYTQNLASWAICQCPVIRTAPSKRPYGLWQ